MITKLNKTVRRVTVETYGYGKRARKLVAAFEKGDLISIREFGCRTKDTARIYDVLWWMKRSKADQDSHGKIAGAQSGVGDATGRAAAT